MRNLIYCIVLFCSCGKYTNTTIHNKDIDNLFIAWNIASSNSIRSLITSTDNEREKALYKNRYEAFKNYLEINDFKTVNNNSLRYKLLKESMKTWNDKFYIIEANELGEQVSIISYILFPYENNTSKIFKYEYKNDGWIKTDEYTKSVPFEYNKIKDTIDFGKGKNRNDVIVTLINKKKIISSDFFLFSTMKALEFKS